MDSKLLRFLVIPQTPLIITPRELCVLKLLYHYVHFFISAATFTDFISCIHFQITHPSVSVGVRPREQRMENDDCFVQIPNEHALEGNGQGEH